MSALPLETLDFTAWKTSACRFEFEGHGIVGHRAGQGAVLLLIHGFPTSSYDWALLWPRLAERYSVYALDMLGFGLSDKPRNYAYSIQASADQWQAHAVSQGLQEVNLLAHDYGNSVAQELLARQREGLLPFKIKAAAFLNGGLFPEATFPILMQKLLRSPLGPWVARLANFASFSGSMHKICTFPPGREELQKHWELLVREEGRRVLPKIIQYIGERSVHSVRWREALQYADMPLCAIIGMDDPISGATIARRWRELLPCSPCIALDGVGHYPQWEDADRVLTHVMHFFSEAGQ